MRLSGLFLGLSLSSIACCVWILETARSGVNIETTHVGTTPVTIYDGQGPTIVVAHGFAGSRQMMQGYGLSLAKAGYRVLAFDFQGHGRNPTAMSGDVSAIDGTTRLLVEQTLEVVAAADSETPVGLLGHSMATDILIRATAQADSQIGPVVAISAFSQAVTAQVPQSMLMITGAWEPGLREFARRAVQMVDEDAAEGDLANKAEVSRKVVVAPFAEHVGVLHSRLGRAESIAWFNSYFQRNFVPEIPPTGPITLLLLLSLVFLAHPLARLAPDQADPMQEPLTQRQFLMVMLVPAVVAPPIAILADLNMLPVLIADHLAVHLGVFGLIQISLLRLFKQQFGHVSWIGMGIVVIWALGIFGFALDRYAANFWPVHERILIISALAVGAVPFMLADALVTRGGRASLARRVLARVGFLASLAFAVALDFEALFFLLMIAPVIVLFFVLFGLAGRWVARRSGAMGAGIGLGLCLAWSLGVSFPMFIGN